MIATTTTLYRESPETWVMLTGFVLAVVASALFAWQCKAGVRKDQAHAAELAERDERIEAVEARCEFLDCHPVRTRRRRVRTPAGRRN